VRERDVPGPGSGFVPLIPQCSTRGDRRRLARLASLSGWAWTIARAASLDVVKLRRRLRLSATTSVCAILKCFELAARSGPPRSRQGRSSPSTSPSPSKFTSTPTRSAKVDRAQEQSRLPRAEPGRKR
jgi:hypothetical protein